MLPLTDIFAAVRWWVALMVLGTAVLPLTWTLFHRLPDRGYAFNKMVGVLLVSYLFWLMTSLGWSSNTLGGIVWAVAGVTAVSLWVYSRQLLPGESLRSWLRQNRRHIWLTEAVFFLLFALWVWVRAQNPSITATEKPMEFAFLNAVGRSPTFPPLDPWLSGYAISYYYFGYVMSSVLGRLAAVPEAMAFNLGIAWLVGGTAVGAFGLVFNLVSGLTAKETTDPAKEAAAYRLAVLLGLVSALALPIAGNQQITLELLHGNGLGSDRFWQWLDVRDINTPAAANATPRYETGLWWWWRSSRVIHEYHLSGTAEEGLEPIVEFPGFSFVLGDMHPHVLALPFAFLSLAVAYLWFLAAGEVEGVPPLWRLMSDPLWLFTAVLLGGLSFLNTWDVLIHLFVVLAAVALGGRQVTGVLRLGVSLVVAALVLYLPFYLGFRSQAGAPYLLPMLMRPTRLAHFLIIFAMPLLNIVVWLLTLVGQQRWRGGKVGLSTAVSLLLTLFSLMFLFGWIVASSPDGAIRLHNLANQLQLTLPVRTATGVDFGWGLRAIFTLLPTLLSGRLSYPALTLFLLLIIALIVMLWSVPLSLPAPQWPTLPHAALFTLLLVLTGTLLTLGPEFLYLRDNFGVRLNTTFKFYYQAWVLFGVAGLVAMGHLWQRARGTAVLVTVGYGTLFGLSLLFPLYAVASRASEFRGPTSAATRQPATLDGLAQLRRYNPDEYEAIMWLRTNEPGTAVLVEAVGGQYSDFARYSANTGLPTLVGWAGHEYQWRGSSTNEPSERDAAVRQIYTDTDWNQTTDLLNHYGVNYIIIGGLERSTYGLTIYDKFDQRLAIAYQNNTVTIYRWQPQTN